MSLHSPELESLVPYKHRAFILPDVGENSQVIGNRHTSSSIECLPEDGSFLVHIPRDFKSLVRHRRRLSILGTDEHICRKSTVGPIIPRENLTGNPSGHRICSPPECTPTQTQGYGASVPLWCCLYDSALSRYKSFRWN
jgi:hypothetical protein